MYSDRAYTLSSNRQPASNERCRESRRDWLVRAGQSAAALPLLTGTLAGSFHGKTASAMIPIATTLPEIRFGLVTYLWGKDMDVPTVIAACEHAGIGGVELRTEHRHAVEPSLSSDQRREVRKKFEDSGVELIGYGSNCEFHSNKPEVLAANIEQCKKYIQLMHDCGGSGVKVKPNAFVQGVDPKQTIEQIGNALNTLAKYGQEYGQQIRLEVHGNKTSHLDVIRDIFAVADHPNAVVCWNSNDEDLLPPGLEANFAMVQSRLGATTHVRELDLGDYPYQQLIQLLVNARYNGWVLLEARTDPADKAVAMKEQRIVFDRMIATAVDKAAANDPSSQQQAK